MRICRARIGQESFYAVLEGGVLRRLRQAPYDGLAYTGQTYAQAEAELLPPAEPSKIICLGKNYADHAKEMGGEAPAEPLLFLKPPSSLIASGEDIIYPPQSQRVDYEAELAVVIGKPCHWVHEEQAHEVIWGYTCLNDVTARDLQKTDGQWTRAKGFDTFCPLGPWLETELDSSCVRVSSRLNGETRQEASTALMIHPVAKIIPYISRIMTLLPGDVIATGTPAGIGPMQPGDTIEIEVEGIGVLRNQVRNP